MTDTPLYAATAADHPTVDTAQPTDYGVPAIEARATADDAERGRALVARLEGGERA